MDPAGRVDGQNGDWMPLTGQHRSICIDQGALSSSGRPADPQTDGSSGMWQTGLDQLRSWQTIGWTGAFDQGDGTAQGYPVTLPQPMEEFQCIHWRSLHGDECTDFLDSSSALIFLRLPQMMFLTIGNSLIVSIPILRIWGRSVNVPPRYWREKGSRLPWVIHLLYDRVCRSRPSPVNLFSSMDLPPGPLCRRHPDPLPCCPEQQGCLFRMSARTRPVPPVAG